MFSQTLKMLSDTVQQRPCCGLSLLVYSSFDMVLKPLHLTRSCVAESIALFQPHSAPFIQQFWFWRAGGTRMVWRRFLQRIATHCRILPEPRLVHRRAGVIVGMAVVPAYAVVVAVLSQHARYSKFHNCPLCDMGDMDATSCKPPA